MPQEIKETRPLLRETVALCSELEDEYDEAKWNRAIENIGTLAHRVDALDIFSSNEFIDDVPTLDLQFLSLGAYRAKLLGMRPSMEKETRIQYLQEALINVRNFAEDYMDMCGYNEEGGATDLNRNDEAKLLRSMLHSAFYGHTLKANPQARRDLLLNHRSEEKKLKGEIEEMTSKINTLAPIGNKGEIDEDVVDDELLRSFTLARLRLQMLELLSDARYWHEEMTMLKQIAGIEEREGGLEKQIARDDEARRKRREQAIASGDPLAHGPLKITRDDIMRGVFGRGYPAAPPTMTPEEWADREIAAGRLPDGGPMNAGNCEGAGQDEEADSDNDADNDEKYRKLRADDDWKDTHPRGWGNRHNKG
eukprot:Clim_evm30s243 gene=Clim_evmTU30s243